MSVPLLDLRAQFAPLREEMLKAVAEVFDSQHFVLGPKVEECEIALADYCHCAHGVGVSSGSDALLVALMAENIGPGDEVITSPYTFFATGGAISRLGAQPVFVDIDPTSYNIDPNLIEAKISDRTRAIIPVHLYGQMAEMDPIMEIANRRNLIVIEDAAQAIGAEYKGRRAGSIGHYGCFSFFPSKNLGAAGDGGLVTTKNALRDEKLRILRAHGAKPKYYHKLVGGNFRLDALQAAVVSVKLPRLDGWTTVRQANAERYGKLFGQTDLIDRGLISLPVIVQSRHIFNQFVIRARQRNELIACLKEQGIGNEVYYPVPLHLQECFADLGYKKNDMPESEKASVETLALPIFPELTDSQAEAVVEAVSMFYK